MNFGKAIEALKNGKKVARKGWNGKGIFIELQRPDENSKMTHPYIFIDTTGLQTDNPDAPKDRVPWLASQTDMLAEDWEEKANNEKVAREFPPGVGANGLYSLKVDLLHLEFTKEFTGEVRRLMYDERLSDEVKQEYNQKFNDLYEKHKIGR